MRIKNIKQYIVALSTEIRMPTSNRIPLSPLQPLCLELSLKLWNKIIHAGRELLPVGYRSWMISRIVACIPWIISFVRDLFPQLFAHLIICWNYVHKLGSSITHTIDMLISTKSLQVKLWNTTPLIWRPYFPMRYSILIDLMPRNPGHASTRRNML